MTLLGVLLSFTPVRKLQGVGATKIGSLFVYVLVATVGLQMNILALADSPMFFLIGAIWLGFHAVLMIVMARLIKAELLPRRRQRSQYWRRGLRARDGGVQPVAHLLSVRCWRCWATLSAPSAAGSPARPCG
ncbi:MAG: DUF819 family protein [Hyphomonadaceae bacterium]